jgi:hypothetical protein
MRPKKKNKKLKYKRVKNDHIRRTIIGSEEEPFE